MKKSEVRQEIFKKRQELSENEIEALSRQVFCRIKQYISSLEQKDSYDMEIFSYASYAHETDTWEFIRECLSKNKRIALPRVGRDGYSMNFYYINSLKDIKSGYKNIPEPSEECILADREEGSKNRVILVPGVAFDKSGNRIGYGKGFYDRYLAAHTFKKTVGVAFEFQIFDKIEYEENDIRLDAVITEKQRYEKR